MSKIRTYVSGYNHKGTIYLNADHVILALYKSGYKQIASDLEKLRDKIRDQIDR